MADSAAALTAGLYLSKTCSTNVSPMSLMIASTACTKAFSSSFNLLEEKLRSTSRCVVVRVVPVPSSEAQKPSEVKSWEVAFKNLLHAAWRPFSVSFLQWIWRAGISVCTPRSVYKSSEVYGFRHTWSMFAKPGTSLSFCSRPQSF